MRPGIPTVNTAVANAAAANALLVQRMMQSGGIQNPVRRTLLAVILIVDLCLIQLQHVGFALTITFTF